MEEWKPILGYEGIYEVSNFGNVRSLDYMHAGEKKILKQVTTKSGYKRTTLCKNGKCKRFYIHRLVAQAFIPNPQSLSEVNHVDEIKSNNRVENLEWCDHKYNMNHGTRNKRAGEKISKAMKGKKRTEETKQKISKAMKGKNTQKRTEETKQKMRENHADFTGTKHPQARKIMCLNNDMIFGCIKDAAEWCGLKGPGNIIKQIQGINKTAGKDPVTGEKLQWKYID